MRPSRLRLISLANVLLATALGLSLSACTIPQDNVTPLADQTPEGPASVTETPPAPTAEPGSDENPLILALPPTSGTLRATQIEGGKRLAGLLMDLTGYVIVTVTPESYLALIEALGSGDAHIAVLPPFAYALADQRGFAQVALVSTRDGQARYGAQFIARADAGFTSYFDPASRRNTADAAVALSQFHEKKPCWTDPLSPAGYVIPAGILARNGVRTRPPAFVQGHPTVVRAVYAGGICDFGATYIDAREFLGLEANYPDVREKVVVIWQIPEIIPYDGVVFATSLPRSLRTTLADAFTSLVAGAEGQEALLAAYEIEALLPADNGHYRDFFLYLEASGIDLLTLVQ